MLAHAIRRGVAGFVLDGAIRDSQSLHERNLPVFAAGVTHRGPYRDAPEKSVSPSQSMVCESRATSFRRLGRRRRCTAGSCRDRLCSGERQERS